MEKFHYYTPEDAIYSNLRETEGRINIICEQEIAHLSELAAELVKDMEDSSFSTSSVYDLLPDSFSGSPIALQANAEILKKIQKARSVWQDVVLCKEIQRQISRKRSIDVDDFFSEFDEISYSAAECIAYQKNNYADTAYLRFSSLLKKPRALYTSGYPSACEEVYNGVCEYCILPLENSSEGILNSFLRLIDRFDLRICATCDITSTDLTRTTRFALVRRTLVPFRLKKGTKQFFEISIPMNSIAAPAAILTAAQLCELPLCRIDTHDHHTGGQTSSNVHFLFEMEGKDPIPFLLYLIIRYPEAIWRGLYPHL